MGATVSLVAVVMWAGALALVGTAARRRDQSLRRGLTLTDFVQDILEREVSRPPREEVFERIRNAEPVDLGGRTGADVIREARREAGRE